jgi:2-polyprenyl-3-methyl-5-hydroxy-6-metoxy-1,4-benzoquinol methylase
MSTQTVIRKDLDEIARKAYLHDSTGEGAIETIVNATHVPGLLRRLQAGEAVLEMGFGEGTITQPLLEAGFRVELVEGSPALCKDARARYGDQLTVHCSYFEDFKPAKPFANVLSLHVLEHVDEPERVVRQMYDWLQPGGQVIAIVPNAESLHRQLAVLMGLQEQHDSLSPRDHLVGHQRVFNLAQLADLFEAAGFEVGEPFGYFVKIVPNGMMKDWRPDLIQSLTRISDQLPPRLLANIGLVARRPQS